MSVRTESKVMRAAPGEEQDVIDFMQKLFWNLLATQEIKTSDNYLMKKMTRFIRSTARITM